MEEPNFVTTTITNESNQNLKAGLIMAALSDPWAKQTLANLAVQKKALIKSLSQGQSASENLGTGQSALPLEIQMAINNLDLIQN